MWLSKNFVVNMSVEAPPILLAQVVKALSTLVVADVES